MPIFKKRPTTEFIAVHCSATPPTMDIGAADIRRWHKLKGWLDIGYHFVIKRDGTVEDGRDVLTQGAHVDGYNHCSVGVCLVGGVSAAAPTDPKKSDSDNRKAQLASHAENNFTDAQFIALLDLLHALKLDYPAAVIQGHRDFPKVSKDCPSFDVRQWLVTHIPPIT